MAAPAARSAIQASRRQLIPGLFGATRVYAPTSTLDQLQHPAALNGLIASPLTASAANHPLFSAFDFGIAAFGKEKPQGEEVTEVPESPDASNEAVTDSNYSSPGMHPKNTSKDAFEPDMNNASPAVTQKASSAIDMDSHMEAATSCGSQEDREAAQAQSSAGVQAAPVETLLKTPLSANNAPSSDRTGPATHDDSPPGVDKDPNIVPPTDLGDDKSGDSSDATSDAKKVDKADKEAWKAMSI